MIDDYGDAKLSDFGASRMLESGGFTPTSETEGTVRWMARELLSNDDEPDGDAIPVSTTESDAWSFGMTILEVSLHMNLITSGVADTGFVQVLTGRLPFFELTHEIQVILSVITGKYPQRPEMDVITDDLWHVLTTII